MHSYQVCEAGQCRSQISAPVPRNAESGAEVNSKPENLSPTQFGSIKYVLAVKISLFSITRETINL